MNQIQIGKFIAETRKSKSLTQRQLADVLSISDKTVSKWECGKGMPELSLMLPLCDALDITVNELLSGERLSDRRYKEKAEENMMDLIKEKQENKKKILLSALAALVGMAGGVPLVMVAGIFEMTTTWRVLFIALGAMVMLGGIVLAVALDWNAGTYECRKCGKRFTPTMSAYINGPHSLTTRRLKCPYCGQKSYCKRRLTH